MNVLPWLVICCFLVLLFTKGLNHHPSLTKVSGIATAIYLSLRLFNFHSLRGSEETVEEINLIFLVICGLYLLILLILEIQIFIAKRDIDESRLSNLEERVRKQSNKITQLEKFIREIKVNPPNK